jgi:hypothetical protein
MEFYPVPVLDEDAYKRNTAHALTLGLPEVERAGNVAVVGGGLSLADHLDTLREWDGPIWAINQTFNYLKERGIKATFFTSDPRPQPWLNIEPGDKALVALHSCPELFEMLKCQVRTYELAPHAVHCGPTTATAAPCLSVWMGHRSVTFFGCDSSFADTSHVYEQEMPRDLILVLNDGDGYVTKPEFLMQADALASVCREFPDRCKNVGRGLLAALIADPERQVVAVSPTILAA